MEHRKLAGLSEIADLNFLTD